LGEEEEGGDEEDDEDNEEAKPPKPTIMSSLGPIVLAVRPCFAASTLLECTEAATPYGAKSTWTISVVWDVVLVIQPPTRKTFSPIVAEPW
jgi:hypothetical protein